MTHCKNQNYKDSKKVSGCLGMLKKKGYIGPKNFEGIRCSLWYDFDRYIHCYRFVKTHKMYNTKREPYKQLWTWSEQGVSVLCSTVVWLVASVGSCESVGAEKTCQLHTCWFNCKSKSAPKMCIKIYNVHFCHDI